MSFISNMFCVVSFLLQNLRRKLKDWLSDFWTPAASCSRYKNAVDEVNDPYKHLPKVVKFTSLNRLWVFKFSAAFGKILHDQKSIYEDYEFFPYLLEASYYQVCMLIL